MPSIAQSGKAAAKAEYLAQRCGSRTIQIMTAWLKIDKEIAPVTYESVVKAYNDDGSVPESGLRLAVEEARRLGKVEREVGLSAVSDFSILREAQREMGIQRR